MNTTQDGRPIAPGRADERATLEGLLEFYRATLARKCSGLDDAQVRTASVPPSSMTPLGLVQHVAQVERNWFQVIFAGLDVPLVYEDTGTDGFGLVPGRGMDEALAVWRAEVERGRELTAGRSLDDITTLTERSAGFLGFREVSLRWILTYLTGEYARHCGHADLLRERIDGATGP
ncbi:hypothetical protein CUT44_23670 [Streptomyces carminius]|uniref:Mini-circle protein n=1 Tax=Streptomyces carminius TaxID=2665496 RepID=A0A2M8LTM5_9ACTN|nr:DinB family protein [Streptomyces carminius]PJE95304.1 hypothetical protein CUT44_23670 [Streptomyces carminius]